jgi:hypothetical protein
MMNKLRNAEEVLDLLITKISLGTYDRKFLQSIQINNVFVHKPITSNQANLFTKVLLKYHKQLTKLNYNAVDLSEIPWTLKIVESSTEYTVPYISIENDTIIMKTPFKTSFVQEMRNERVFKWDFNARHYSAIYGLPTLKYAIDSVNKHYEQMKCSDNVLEIIDEIIKYESAKIWSPTLVRVNGNLIIAGINEALHEALLDVKLDTSIKTLALLTMHGVKIDDKLFKELHEELGGDEASYQRLLFATSYEYELEQNKIWDLKELLHDIDCDYIFYSTFFAKTKTVDIESVLCNFNIDHDVGSKASFLSQEKNKLWSREKKMPVLVKYGSLSHKGSGSAFAAKMISLVDSTPVQVK